jgi:hypothetical protein
LTCPFCNSDRDKTEEEHVEDFNEEGGDK